MWIQQESINSGIRKIPDFLLGATMMRKNPARAQGGSAAMFFLGYMSLFLGYQPTAEVLHRSAEPPAILFPAKYDKAPMSVTACSERCLHCASRRLYRR
jgi:hypothetical protein